MTLDVFKEIAQAGEVEIEKLLDAVMHRYGELFPDWEIGTVSIQKKICPKRTT